MTDIPRRTAFEALLKLDSSGYTKIDSALDSLFFKSGLDSRDRGFVSELVYGVVRWRRSLDAITHSVCQRPITDIDPPALMLLRMGVYQIVGMTRVPNSAAVNEIVNLAKLYPATTRATGFINGVLRGVIRRIGTGTKPIWEIVETVQRKHLPEEVKLGERYSFPDWLAARWISGFGHDAAVSIMRENCSQAQVFFRVNGLRISMDGFAGRTHEWGLDVEPMGYVDGAFRLLKGKIYPSTDIFRNGYVQPQDGSSIIAASLLDVRPGDVVADVCCGRGVKSGMFAERMNNRGVLFCMDNLRKKIDQLRVNMERLAVSIARPVVANAALRWPVRRSFSRIFIDAPCSGTGVLRRHPEGKWNKTPETVERHASLQREILNSAADHLAPGGEIVYSVCSIEPEEGINLVSEFLNRRSDFERVNLRTERPELADIIRDTGDMMILPGWNGMDGFFAAKLKKKTS